MLVEFLKEPVLLNGSEYVKDLRINVTKEKQMRIKAKYLGSGTEVPIDLVVYRYTLPNFTKPPVVNVSMDGRNMTINSNFKLNVSYNYMNGKWKLDYQSVTKTIQHEGQSLLEQIRDILNDVLQLPMGNKK